MLRVLHPVLLDRLQNDYSVFSLYYLVAMGFFPLAKM